MRAAPIQRCADCEEGAVWEKAHPHKACLRDASCCCLVCAILFGAATFWLALFSGVIMMLYGTGAAITITNTTTHPNATDAIQRPLFKFDHCVTLLEPDVRYGRFALSTWEHTAVYQKDNNLVVYGNQEQNVIWAHVSVAKGPFTGIHRDSFGDWYIGDRKAFPLPATPRANSLCLNMDGKLVRETL